MAIPLTPHLVGKIWGGSRLETLKNKSLSEPIGEAWEISTLAEGTSLTPNKPLSELCNLPYLVKLIDTSDNLSVQVHPGDEYAAKHENSSGKTECWLILDADNSAGIYLGFKEGVDEETFRKAVNNSEAVDNLLVFYPVKRGDFFFVPAGAVHAIGKGVFLAEAQQSSGITYRVWDWNRVGTDGKPRELHIEKAMDVLNFDAEFNLNLARMHEKDTLAKSAALVAHKDFNLRVNTLTSGEKTLPPQEGGRPIGITVLEGSVTIGNKEFHQYQSALLETPEEIIASKDSVHIAVS